MPSHYEILGVSNTAGLNEIKSAFRRLAKQYHPDKNPGGKDTFEKILIAYEVLSDRNRREQYDLKLKYSSSVNEANTHSSRTKKKQWGFTDEDLRRRQYYQEHYKKQYTEAQSKAGNSSNKKIYNEYKYILFATPLAVALLMFIIKGFEKKPVDIALATPKIIAENTVTLKMGDSPYTLYFGDPVFDTIAKKVVKFKNPGSMDVIVCLFNKEQKFIRSCFVQSGYYAEISQIPNEKLLLKLFFGKKWNPSGFISTGEPVGKFDSVSGFYKSGLELTKGITELILDEKHVSSHDKISEKDFFHRNK